MNDLLVGGFRSGEPDLLVYTANRYMRELTEVEQGLQGVYDLVLGLIAETLGERPIRPRSSTRLGSGAVASRVPVR